MDLDELKPLLNRHLEVNHRVLDMDELLAAIRQKKDSALEKLRRQLLFECILATVVVLALITRGLPFEGLPDQIVMVALVVLTVLQLVYFGYEYRRLGHIVLAVGNLKDHLTGSLVRLETLVKLYRRFTLWGIPVGMGLGIWVGLSRTEYQLVRSFDSLDLLIATFLAVFCLLGLLAVRLALNWYLDRYYLRHLRALRECLAELQEE
jgi:hypothetical protein